MKIKLDLHPIYNDTQKIEAELAQVIDEAVAKRATEVEIIPGKGSGALKKTVLRFLDRPDVKSRYHRLEKDSDNWGRLFVHFRHERAQDVRRAAAPAAVTTFSCACCHEAVAASATLLDQATATGSEHIVTCPVCETPNRLTVWLDRGGTVHIKSALGYD